MTLKEFESKVESATIGTKIVVTRQDGITPFMIGYLTQSRADKINCKVQLIPGMVGIGNDNPIDGLEIVFMNK